MELFHLALLFHAVALNNVQHILSTETFFAVQSKVEGIFFGEGRGRIPGGLPTKKIILSEKVAMGVMMVL